MVVSSAAHRPSSYQPVVAASPAQPRNSTRSQQPGGASAVQEGTSSAAAKPTGTTGEVQVAASYPDVSPECGSVCSTRSAGAASTSPSGPAATPSAVPRCRSAGKRKRWYVTSRPGSTAVMRAPVGSDPGRWPGGCRSLPASIAYPKVFCNDGGRGRLGGPH
ncbi:hypothetical protein B0E53_05026 [Micromonospora sp. MH33]|nr:hypothetical protein B0E53_05026 [Micromonospora sp. MH33]